MSHKVRIRAADLAVIGSGAAGFAAAIAARHKGRSVIMIERGTIGGTCVNVGCVPSKALLAAAEVRKVSLDEERFPGLTTTPFAVDLATMINGKRQLVDRLRAEKYVDLAAEYGWDILPGEARFAGDPDQPGLEVRLSGGTTTTIEAHHYLIATGSTPWAPPIGGLAEAGYLTSTTAMELDRLPESMIIIGGNAVGLEQAQLWSRLGATVQIVEALDRLAPYDEPEISATIAQVFTREDIGVHTSANLSGVARDHRGYHLTVAGRPDRLHAERLLVATGRRPVTDRLHLDQVGVKTGDRGGVVVDDQLRSTNHRVWAAGDVTGHPQFVYVAGAHGNLVADNAFDDAGRTVDYRHLPRVTFTSPAIAAVGLTEAEALAAGYRPECRVLPLDRVPRALINRDTSGLIKLIADAETGRLVGAHVLAEGAGDVIAAAGYALAGQLTVQQIADHWAPYLTMAEALKLTAQTFTRDVSKLSCCAS